MGWVPWIIPLIAVAVWILSSIAKVQQDAALRGNRPRRPNREQTEDEAQRRANERANRLLEEIRRRKQREAPPPLPKPAQEKPKPRAVSTAQRIEDLDVALAARKAAMSWQTPAEPEIGEPVIAVPIPARAPTHMAPTVTTRLPSKAAQRLRAMLSSPQTLSAAILLNEVLGPPRCRRRLGR